MKCPYCKQATEDDATVCPHCQRDLVLYSPIARKCARTERGLDALNKSLGEIDLGPGSAIAASIVVAFLFDYTSWSALATGWIGVLFESLAVVTPFFAAIVLGCFSGRISTRACCAVGIIVGFGGFAAHLMVWSFGALESAYNRCVDFMNHMPNGGCQSAALLPEHWYISFATYPTAGVLLFISGHAFGRMLSPSPFQRWVTDGNRVPAGGAQMVSRGLVALAGILTAVLPKMIDYLISTHAQSTSGAGH